MAAREKGRFMSSHRLCAAVVVASTLASASLAAADEPAPAPETPPASTEPTKEATPAPAAPATPEVEPKHDYKPPPAPYSLPWQLRGVVPANLVRSDTSIAMYKNDGPGGNGNSGNTIATTLLASYKVMPDLAPFVRLALVKNHPFDTSTATTATVKDATVFGNPAVGATYGIKIGSDMKLGLMLAATVPIGSGGGTKPTDPAALADYVATRTALGAGIRARSSMDNALFATNFLTIFPGVGFAFVKSGLTVQAEATVLFLKRVRGGDAEDDKAKTNFTAGLHVGYFVIKELSIGAEIRHQRWLNTPSDVTADQAKASDQQLGLKDQTTWAAGVRGHFKIGESMWLRPGVSFTMAIDDPMKALAYKIVQVDIPFVF